MLLPKGTERLETVRINPLVMRPTKTQPTRYSRSPWRVVECQETGFVFLENPPEYSQLSKELAWEKTRPAESLLRSQKEPVLAALSGWVKKARRAIRGCPRVEREALRLLVRIGAGGRSLNLLDLGCGSGRKLCGIVERMSDEHGVRVIPHGIEISEELASRARATLSGDGGRVIHAPAIVGLAQFEDESVDLMILSSYLEHEIHPLEALRQCRSKLSADGRIIIKVPNFNSLNRRFRQGRWCGFRYPDHVNYFTPETLRLLVESSELRVARMNFFDRLPTSDNMWMIARR